MIVDNTVNVLNATALHSSMIKVVNFTFVYLTTKKKKKKEVGRISLLICGGRVVHGGRQC